VDKDPKKLWSYWNRETKQVFVYGLIFIMILFSVNVEGVLVGVTYIYHTPHHQFFDIVIKILRSAKIMASVLRILEALQPIAFFET
jgi:hypothetical protein